MSKEFKRNYLWRDEDGRSTYIAAIAKAVDNEYSRIYSCMDGKHIFKNVDDEDVDLVTEMLITEATSYIKHKAEMFKAVLCDLEDFYLPHMPETYKKKHRKP